MCKKRTEIQYLFHRWLQHRQLDGLSFRTIKQSALEFMRGFPDEDVLSNGENPLDVLFYPLLRSGVAEYRGNSRYGLSPTCNVLLDDQVLLVNYPKAVEEARSLLPGLQLLSESRQPQNEYPTTLFKLDSVLKQIPSFEKVILKSPDFTKNTHTLSRSWLIRRQGDWISQEGLSGLNYIELFKNSDNYGADSHLKIGKVVYDLPARERNPQAFALASMLVQISLPRSDEWRPVEITSSGELRINLSIFPQQLEKCFLLETIRLGFLPGSEGKSRLYKVDLKFLPKLRELFLIDKI